MDDTEIVDAEIVDEPGDNLPVIPDAEVARPYSVSLTPLRTLRVGIAQLDEERKALEAAGDYEGLANGGADIAMIVGDLRTVERDTKLGLARVLDAKWVAEGKMRYQKDDPTRFRSRPKEEIEGLGLVEVEAGNERKGWESENLLRKLIDTALVTEDGELIEGTATEVAQRIYDVISGCLPLTGSLQWRVGSFDKVTETWSGLRGMGIDPSAWCEEVERDRIAKIPKRNPEAS